MVQERPTRERLLEAAIDAIEAAGEVSVRVDRIAAAAGVTKPMIYAHFRERDGLIVAAQAERYRRALAFGLSEMAAAVDRCTSADDYAALMRGWVRSFADADGMRRRAMRIEVLGSAVARPALREAIRAVTAEHVASLAATISSAQQRGWVTQRFTAATFAAWWTGLVLSRHTIETHPDTYDLDEWDAMTSMILQFVSTSGDWPEPTQAP